MTLAELKIGQDAVLRTIGGQGELRHHLLDMGLTPGTEVTLRKIAPMGDPIEVELRGYELTLRLADAAKIEVENVHETDRAARSEERHAPVPHPGVGELRKAPSYHDRKAGAEIAKGQPLHLALAGNQNCGKTTLFNQLTGSNQHVGNFPGVTVDRKDGTIRGHEEATVTDLPGIYSLSPYSSEEIVTRDFLLNTHPDAIINIVDASNIERNLYLTMQLMELNIPLVLALNMMDEVRANGGTIMVNALEELLGVPVVPISAAKNEGIDELVEHVLHVARHRETPGRIDFCDAGDGKGGAVHRCIHAVNHLIEDHAARAGLPVRFAATKLVEGDPLIEKALDLDKNETELLAHTIAELESETGLDREAALADMRFNFIERLCDKTVVRPGESREHKRSVAIDKVLTGKYTALPCFIGIMALVFWLTFGVIGAGLSDLLTLGIDALTGLTDRALTAEESTRVSELLHTLSDFERIGDYAVNVSESAVVLHDRNITFSPQARAELERLTAAVGETLDKTVACYQSRQRTLAVQVEPLEEVVDLIAATLKNRHVERLKAGECTIELGTQFLELLINLERMSDHCSNVALHILRQTSSPDDKVRIDSHAYMHELHHGGFNQEFDDLFQEYRTKYFQPIAGDPERV